MMDENGWLKSIAPGAKNGKYAMIFGSAILATALLLSLVAAYYSIMGLTAIFAAATIPVIVMGASLELGKVVATVWLHNNWRRASWLFKTYLVPAVFFLMLLTSMGIFGFLSKAHLDQSLISGDVTAKIAIFDEKIKTERENIDANRKQLKQMDEAVDQVMARSTSEEGASRSSAIRKSQQKERGRLLEDISKSQQRITALNEERAPIAAEVRKVEAEVGPIKYIAALLYGDNPDSGILEKAVRFVIIMIVLVFDPLALCLILSANKQFEWARHGEGGWVHDEDTKDTKDTKVADWFDHARERAQFWDQQPKPEPEFEGVREPGGEWIQTGPAFRYQGSSHATGTDDPIDFPKYEPDDGPLTEEQIEAIKETAKNELPTGPVISRQELFAPVTEEPPLPAPVAGRVVSAGGEYVEINGKRMHHKAFDMHSQDAGHAVERHERARLQADNDPAVVGPTSGFGIAFPDSPTKGDTYLRVDRLPTVLYKFNGRDWIEIDKEISNSYVYQDSYIDHLIAKIGSGEYDPDLLSDTEREAIAQRLKNNNPTE
jgi:hypothetical protein